MKKGNWINFLMLFERTIKKGNAGVNKTIVAISEARNGGKIPWANVKIHENNTVPFLNMKVLCTIEYVRASRLRRLARRVKTLPAV